MALNLFWEKAIDSAKRFELGVGLRNAVYFVQDGWSNTDMDPANNGFPRNGKDFATLRNGFGALFDLKTSLSVLFRYCFLQDSKYRFYIGILPDISVYWPNPEGSRLFQVFNQTGVLYTVYEGYTDFYKGKDDGHNSYDIKIDITTPAKIQEMRNADYALVHTIKEDKITNTGNLGIYRRSFATPNRRDGSSFILNGAHAKGTSLRDSASMLANNINTTKYDFINQRALWQVFYKNALKESRALHKLMASKPLSIKEIEKY